MLFDSFDQNNDGHISRQEIPNRLFCWLEDNASAHNIPLGSVLPDSHQIKIANYCAVDGAGNDSTKHHPRLDYERNYNDNRNNGGTENTTNIDLKLIKKTPFQEKNQILDEDCEENYYSCDPIPESLKIAEEKGPAFRSRQANNNLQRIIILDNHDANQARELKLLMKQQSDEKDKSHQVNKKWDDAADNEEHWESIDPMSLRPQCQKIQFNYSNNNLNNINGIECQRNIIQTPDTSNHSRTSSSSQPQNLFKLKPISLNHKPNWSGNSVNQPTSECLMTNFSDQVATPTEYNAKDDRNCRPPMSNGLGNSPKLSSRSGLISSLSSNLSSSTTDTVCFKEPVEQHNNFSHSSEQLDKPQIDQHQSEFPQINSNQIGGGERQTAAQESYQLIKELLLNIQLLQQENCKLASKWASTTTTTIRKEIEPNFQQQQQQQQQLLSKTGALQLFHISSLESLSSAPFSLFPEAQEIKYIKKFDSKNNLLKSSCRPKRNLFFTDRYRARRPRHIRPSNYQHLNEKEIVSFFTNFSSNNNGKIDVAKNEKSDFKTNYQNGQTGTDYVRLMKFADISSNSLVSNKEGDPVQSPTRIMNGRPKMLQRQSAISDVSIGKQLKPSDCHHNNVHQSSNSIGENSKQLAFDFGLRSTVRQSNCESECFHKITKSISTIAKNNCNSYNSSSSNRHHSVVSLVQTNLQQHFKIIFIGDPSVGKTSFINSAIDGTFSPKFGPTIGIDFKIKTMLIDGKWHELQLWDTAGQERYRSITSNYYRKVDGICLMYDLTNEQTFLNINSWINSIHDTGLETAKSASIPILVLCNKIDVRKKNNLDVHHKTRHSFMTMLKGCHFMETSAKTGHNVEASLRTICRLMIEANKSRKLSKQEEEADSSIIVDLKTKSNLKNSCCRSQ